MRLDKKITYICNYKNTSWQCVLKDISIDDRITGFTVSARGSRYRVYVINFDMKRWLDIPGIGVSSELLNRKFSTKKIIQKLQIKKTNGLRKMPFQTALHQP